MPLDLEDDEQRRVFKEVLSDAIDDWLNKQFTAFGKWSFRGIVSIALGVLAYYYFTTHGMKP